MTTTPNLFLTKLSIAELDTVVDLVLAFNANMDILDGVASNKCKWDAITAPTGNDDSADGYTVGSFWFDIAHVALYQCTDNTLGAAVWELVMFAPIANTDNYIPQWDGTDTGKLKNGKAAPTGDIVGTTDSQTLSAKTLASPKIDDSDQGVTITSANQTHATPVVTIPDIGGAADEFVMKSLAQDAPITQKQITTPANPTAGYNKVYPKSDNKLYILTSAGAENVVGSGDVSGPATNTADKIPQWNGANSKLLKDGLALVTSIGTPGTDGNIPSEKAVRDALGGGSAFWTTVPGSPVRVSDTQFTLTDTGNAGLLDKRFVKTIILKWTDGGNFKTAMVISSSYAANTVTVNIVGDALAVGFTDMKYCMEQARYLEWIVPGVQATGINAGRFHYAACDMIKLSVDARLMSYGTTNNQVVDVNANGSTIITTKPTLTSGSYADLDNVCDNPSTPIPAGAYMNIDIDAVHATPGLELYVYLYWYPEAWRYVP